MIQPVPGIRMELRLCCVWAAQNPLRSDSPRSGVCNLYLQTLTPQWLRDPMGAVSSCTSDLLCISKMASGKALRRKKREMLKFLLEVGRGLNAWTCPLGLQKRWDMEHRWPPLARVSSALIMPT